MSEPTTFVEWLNERMQSLYLTRRDLAQQTEYSYEAIQKVAKGERPVSRELADKLTKPLRIPEVSKAEFIQSAIAKEAPSMSARPIPQNNLPDDVPDLVGRCEDIERVCKRLRSGSRSRRTGKVVPGANTRLLTLMGAPGVGKTSLALAAGRALLFDFPDGVFFVSLASVVQRELVPLTISRTLKVQEIAGENVLVTLARQLRGKRMLLLLDNFEQVLAAAPDIAELLRAAGTWKALITSRQRLNISDEHRQLVQPLDVPTLSTHDWLAKTRERPLASGKQRRHAEKYASANKLFEVVGPIVKSEDLLKYPSIELFIRRVRTRDEDFQLDEENGFAIASVCAHLNGLPLAIELAAARIQPLSPMAMLSSLEKTLEVLTRGAVDLPSRLQSLRAAVQWSYDLLGSPSGHEEELEQALFRRLAVFVGAYTMASVTEVCNTHLPTKGSTEGLDALVEKNLLEFREVHGEPLYSMLEPIREYALEKLRESGEEIKLREQHSGYYLRLAREAEIEMSQPLPTEAIRRLQIEQENADAACMWAIEVGNIQRAIDIALPFFEFLYGQGQYYRAYLLTDRIADAVLAAGLESRLPMLLRNLGRIELVRGAITQAQAHFIRALNIAIEHGNVEAEATLQMSLGTAYRYGGRTQEALAHYERALSLARSHNLPSIAFRVSASLAGMAHARGDYSVAEKRNTEAWGLAIQLNNPDFISHASMGIATAKMELGDLHGAEKLLQAALLQPGLGERNDLTSYLLINLGDVQSRQGRYAKATESLSRALDLAMDAGHLPITAGALSRLAIVEEKQGNQDRAAALIDAALVTAYDAALSDVVASVLINRAWITRLHGDIVAAKSDIVAALEIVLQLGDPLLISAAKEEEGNILLAEGDPTASLMRLEESLELAKSMKSSERQAYAMFALAKLERHTENYEVARRLGEESRHLFENLSHNMAEIVTQWLLELQC